VVRLSWVNTSVGYAGSTQLSFQGANNGSLVTGSCAGVTTPVLTGRMDFIFFDMGDV
jgi:hypothetical protein